MKPSYHKWRKRLELVASGINPKDWPAELQATTDGATADDCGFYRAPVSERIPLKNGQGTKWATVGFLPVAMIVHEDELLAYRGEQTLTAQTLTEEFLSFVSYPISEDWYRAVAEKGQPWPDVHDPKIYSNRTTRTPEDAALVKQEAARKEAEFDDEKTPQQKLLDDLAEHAKGIPTYAEIEDDILLSQAHDLRDKIKKVENAAESARKAEKDFYLKKGREIDDSWRGVITAAQTMYAEISTPMNKWVNSKLEAQRLYDERMAVQQRAHDDAVAAAEAANRPAPPPPEPAPAPNLPAPSMQVRSGGGARASNVKVNKIVTITDEAAVYKHMAGNAELTAVLLKLATIATNAGLNVPGTTWKPEAKV